ncbi:MAG: M15 family metallopeptidase [Promicromonosporaceae bacterium]|nr:M15 family metallopeptidase [Promicromonosporaceae bacterium]
MVTIAGTNRRVRKEFAAGVNAFRDAFRARFGYLPVIVESYRDYAEQVRLWNAYQSGKGNLAAYPGTSLHGWGESIDWASRIDVYGTPEKQWADANGPKYGLAPTGNGFSQREAWHFDWNGTVYKPPAPPKPPKQEEDDMPKNSGCAWVRASDKRNVRAVFNTDSGFWWPWTDNDIKISDVQKAFDVPSFATVTEGGAKGIEAMCALVRSRQEK